MKSVTDLTQILEQIQLVGILAHPSYQPEGSNNARAKLALLSEIDCTLPW